jgi:ABC-type polysaccharide/polyol phosphate export permease
VDSGFRIHFLEAIADLKTGLLDYRSWLSRSLRMSRQKYRLTYLGPWWTTLSSILTLLVLSLLRSAVSQDVSFTESLTYVGVGWVVFNLLSKPLSTGMTIFILESPFATHGTTISSSVFRDAASNAIEFAHEFVAVLILISIFHDQLHLAIPITGFLITSIIISNIGMTLWLGSISCRFRDIAPIALLLLRVQMFLSPIFWSISDASDSSLLVSLASWNPFSYFMTQMRDGFFGTSESSQLHFNPFAVITTYAVINLVIGIVVFSYSRKRLAYWALST